MMMRDERQKRGKRETRERQKRGKREARERDKREEMSQKKNRIFINIFKK